MDSFLLNLIPMALTIPMPCSINVRRDFRLLDDAAAEACSFLAARGLRVGIEFQVEDAITIAAELIGAADAG